MSAQDKPVRVRLSRAKGWRMPDNTVKVDRSTMWGNPFIVNPHVRPGAGSGGGYICLPTVEDAVACFREMLMVADAPAGSRGEIMRTRLPELRGKNLGCWCAIGSPCHADVLLELANPTPSPGEREL